MKKFLTPVIAGMLLLSGCANNAPSAINPATPPAATPPQQIACTMEYRYGLTINLTDESGNELNGATITVLEGNQPAGTPAEFEKVPMGGTYVGLGEGSGQYKVKIEKEGYVSQELSVNLEHDACHVHPQAKDIVLKKA
jgi:hypothetical protein